MPPSLQPQFVLGVVEGSQRILNRARVFRRQQFVHILLFPGQMLADPFFRSRPIKFTHPNVKRIDLGKAARSHGNQE
jgi:hypothetical protein